MSDKRITTDELDRLFHTMDGQGSQNTTEQLAIQPGLPDENEENLETIHVYPLGTGLYVTKVPLPTTTNVSDQLFTDSVPDSVPAQTPFHPRRLTKEQIIAGVVCFLAFSLIFFNVANAFYVVFLQTASITISAEERTITTSQTIHLVKGLPTSPFQLQERDLNTITLSQQKTVAATGSYHQDPTYAVGYITFYNGSFSSVTISAGTQLQSANGIQVETTQDAIVPGVDQSATPPTLGQATVPAHAVMNGTAGNIQAFAINGQCCAPSVLAKNTQAFTGGQDAQNYTIVTQKDITQPAETLRVNLAQIIHTTFAAQAEQNEMVLYGPCTPTITTNHKAGDQATSVTITATGTCGAVAYNKNDPQQKASSLLSQDAFKTLKKGFRLLGTIACTTPSVQKEQSSIRLLISCHSIWVYIPTNREQEHIKHVIAGKRVEQAKRILLECV